MLRRSFRLVSGVKTGLRCDALPADQFLFHVTPLHYLLRIFESGALYPKSVLAADKIAPRAGASRRDRMLGLADWVHLSLRADTPLLRDKLRRGYPHVLLVFNRAAVLTLPEVALLPFNTKAWRSRSEFIPVTDPQEKTNLLMRHHQSKRYPSLEVLVHYGLTLHALENVAFAAASELSLVEETMAALDLAVPVPLILDPALFPLPEHYHSTTIAALSNYFAACREAHALLPPPPIPFD